MAGVLLSGPNGHREELPGPNGDDGVPCSPVGFCDVALDVLCSASTCGAVNGVGLMMLIAKSTVIFAPICGYSHLF